ncbi:glycosyltransferase family 2 protein [Oculatella sp. FACHB-28]|uniref:glycosyltransferase n=1 Tax=Cyanophyceae TaxID=3028117 RepID=UPI00168224BC|nr:glycosyltransferase family 2 protein [Leptolyngbya sp. FACHB-541]MBD2059908.1 glycosyltransferase family 2 protein [Oculatella sp. FACHB-28]
MTILTQIPDISIVVPAFNEEQTLEALLDRIVNVTEQIPDQKFEVIFIDDGSTDRSWAILQSLAAKESWVRCFRLRRNFGKAAALSIGASMARGDILITMDADLQDDPKEIPRFLEKLKEGYDLVSGWKRNRKDPLSKTLPSKIFNTAICLVSDVKLRDFNCGFKAARKEVYQNISLYGELHRYIPLLAHNLGYRVGEIPVLHHPRAAGKSKYGLERYARGFLDLLTVLTITRYGRRPGHLFGGVGLISGMAGFLILSYLTGVWVFTSEAIGGRPLLLLGIMLEILSAQLLSLGMLAELVLNCSPSQPTHLLIADSSDISTAYNKEKSYL